ncbi:MAG: hypothetical protein J3K34DRAFT_527421 [Monoraphidium minutum]|nr:MAG: hypothetical protein J3K34DRAFT_527421 [Monoraphidium minutum]
MAPAAAAAPPPAAGTLLLRLPAFLFAVWLMYWSLALGVLATYIPVWDLKGPRNDTFYWVQFLCGALRIKFRKRGEGQLYAGPGPALWLSNHRSWADFFVDAYLAGGRAQMLSRMMVLYAFPMFMLPVMCLRGCIVFKRGSIADKESFNKWLDDQIEASPQVGLMVYPEGHRSMLPRSLPLKRGMLHYAYSRKLPVQIIMSGNKEAVIAEKTGVVGFGCTVVTSYSEMIAAGDYASFEEFMARVQQLWDAEWLATMSADAADLPPLELSGTIDNNAYPPVLLASQLAWAAVAIVLMIWTAAMSWRGLMAATALLGPAGQQLVVALLAGWFVTSLVFCYDTSLPKPLLNADGSLRAGGGGADGGAADGGAAGGGAAGNGAPEAPAGGKAAPAANGLHQRKNSH